MSYSSTPTQKYVQTELNHFHHHNHFELSILDWFKYLWFLYNYKFIFEIESNRIQLQSPINIKLSGLF